MKFLTNHSLIAVFSIALTITVSFSSASAQLPDPPKPEPPKTAPPVPVTGANGKVVSFLGIKAATPKGLTVLMIADGPINGITWDKLDLMALKRDHPHIYAAYEDATKNGKTTELNLGSYEDITIKESKKVLDGHYLNTISGLKFAIQMPAGTPKGILVLMADNRGQSTRLLPHGFDETSHFPELRATYRLAIMAFDEPNVENIAYDAVDPLVFADKKSGPALLKAIEAFAKDSGQPSMVEAPIILYGAGKTGSAFCYNFAHWKPERVQAVVVSNGAFYSQTPTAESAKIPFLFLWGQYNDNAEKWKATNTRKEIFKTHASLKPNWISAMEYRGRGSDSQIHDYFARDFLKRMIRLRKIKVKVKPEPKEETEEEKEEGKKENPEKKKEEEEKPEEEEEEGVQFWEIPRESSYVGNTETFEIKKIKDPNAPLGENETWLPNEDFAKMWKALGLGELEPK